MDEALEKIEEAKELWGKIGSMKEKEIDAVKGLRGAWRLCKEGKRGGNFCLRLLDDVEDYHDDLKRA